MLAAARLCRGARSIPVNKRVHEKCTIYFEDCLRSMFYRPAASAMNVELGQRAAAFDNVTYLLHNRVEGERRRRRACD